MRSLWKGTIAFGLVTIPVKMYTATRESTISFHNLCPEHLVPLTYKKWCPAGENEVDYRSMKKGYEIGGAYVVIEQKELDALKLESTHTIDIDTFVDSASVPQLACESFYFLAPEKGGEKAYALLRDVLALTGKTGIGKVILHNKEHVVGITSFQKGIVLVTLRYAGEMVDIRDVLPVELPEPSDRERQLAQVLVEKMSGELNLNNYRDRYREEVEELVKKKLKGEEVAKREVKEVEKTKDILEALEKSIAAEVK